MNTRIEQLTRNYLNNLPGWNSLSEQQKREIIRINGETEWIIFNAGSLRAKIQAAAGYTQTLMVDEYGYLLHYVVGMGYERRNQRINDYIRQNRNRIRLVGDYRLGVLRNGIFREGEFDDFREEDREDGTPGRVWRTQAVYGRVRNEEGIVSGGLIHLLEPSRESDRGLNPENYDINSPQLQDILDEVVKIYYYYYKNHLDERPEGIGIHTIEDADISTLEKPNSFNFIRGDGYRFFQGHNHTIPAFPTDEEGRGNGDYWGAVKKVAIIEGNYAMYEPMFTLENRGNWKKSRNLTDLLNDYEIINSRERSSSDSNSSSNSAADNSPPPHTHTNDYDNEDQDQPQTSPPSATQTIQFKIKSVENNCDTGFNLFDIESDSPIAINGRQVVFIDIMGRKAMNAYQNGDLQPGNTIAITNIRFAPNKANINGHNELWIGKNYDNIQVISSATPPPTSPSPDSPPAFFPEVGQENQVLNQEENKMVLLSEELLKIIEDNNQTCQEAQNFGIKLPEIPSDALNYFQEEFFALLDENQPLNSPHNSQINTENKNIRKKKLNIKENIYGIYNNNKKKLTEKKTGQTTSPKNELEKLKEEAKERINQILTDKDNLRNINLTTLAKGKYQNWEKDIEGLTSEKEMLAYVEDFLGALKETGAEEKEKDKNNKVNSNNSQSSPENNLINDSAERVINKLPLPAAKNFAKKKIRELFKKYKPDLEKIKKTWEGEKSWMSYLEKCDSPEKIMAFLKKLEKAIISQQILSQTGNKNKKLSSPNSWIIPFIIVSLTVLVGLILIIKLRYKRKK